MRAILSRRAALLVFLGAAATLAGAMIFEYGLGLTPCPLCLLQRKPYYLGTAIALVAAFLPPQSRSSRFAHLLLAALFLVSAGLGAYHAGVEWMWWPGPSDCSGSAAAPPADIGGFLDSLSRTRVVSCTEAAWRLWGLSLAGWNVLISVCLAGLALLGARGRRLGHPPTIAL